MNTDEFNYWFAMFHVWLHTSLRGHDGICCQSFFFSQTNDTRVSPYCQIYTGMLSKLVNNLGEIRRPVATGPFPFTITCEADFAY